MIREQKITIGNVAKLNDFNMTNGFETKSFDSTILENCKGWFLEKDERYYRFAFNHPAEEWEEANHITLFRIQWITDDINVAKGRNDMMQTAEELCDDGVDDWTEQFGEEYMTLDEIAWKNKWHKIHTALTDESIRPIVEAIEVALIDETIDEEDADVIIDCIQMDDLAEAYFTIKEIDEGLAEDIKAFATFKVGEELLGE